MPLFACVSGCFLEEFVQKRTFAQGLLRKIETLLLPCLVWAMGFYAIYIIRYHQLNSLSFFLKNDILGANWFLWAIFYSSVIILLISRFDKNIWATGSLLILVNVLVPDYLNTTGYKVLFPFVMIGMLIKRYHMVDRFLQLKNIIQWTLIIALMMLYLLQHPWITSKYPWEVYIHSDLHLLYLLAERWVIHLTGVAASLLLMIKVSSLLDRILDERKNPILQLGRCSLGIYLFQSFFYANFTRKLSIHTGWNSYAQCAYTFFLSIFLTMLCFLCVKIVERIPILSLLLLGKRRMKRI